MLTLWFRQFFMLLCLESVGGRQWCINDAHHTHMEINFVRKKISELCNCQYFLIIRKYCGCTLCLVVMKFLVSGDAMQISMMLFCNNWLIQKVFCEKFVKLISFYRWCFFSSWWKSCFASYWLRWTSSFYSQFKDKIFYSI